MRLKPPFYPQETPDSCVPACLRMVLSELGVEVSESELRKLCDCTIFGTDAFQAVKAARQLGFPQTYKANLEITQLGKLIEQDHYPIVYVELLPIEKVRGTHALIAVEMNESRIGILNPLKGMCYLERAEFEAAFKVTNGLTIIVEA